MKPAFEDTTRSLEGDQGPRLVVLRVVIAMIVIWAAWMGFGRVTLYAASTQAQVRAEGAVRLRAPVSGVVREVAVRLGQRVEAGQPLVQLDDTEVAHELAAAEARLAAHEARLLSLDEAGAADDVSAEAARSVGSASLGQSIASLREAEVLHADAVEQEARTVALAEAGAVSRSELEQASAHRAVLAARLEAARREVSRLRGEQHRSTALLQAGAHRHEEERQALLGEISAARALVARWREQVARRSLTAPVAGVVAEMQPLHAGQYVDAGASLVVVVPDAPPVVEARFPAERAVGRIRAGQRAMVKVKGAMGGLLGARAAVVQQVGSEPGPDGSVTVYLGFPETHEDLQHGLLAEVEVAVEQVSPWTVALRAAGEATP